MKKFLMILAAAVFLTALPMKAAKAEELSKEQKAQYMMQVKQVRQLVKQNSATLKKMELRINNRKEELGKVLMLLFDSEMPPNGQKLSQIQNKQEAILEKGEQIAVLKKSINRLKTEASVNINEQNYALAMIKFDKLTTLQYNEEELLKEYDKNLQEFIEMLKSLQYK